MQNWRYPDDKFCFHYHKIHKIFIVEMRLKFTNLRLVKLSRGQWVKMTSTALRAIELTIEYTWCMGNPGIFNSLWPNDTIWWQGSGSTLAQVMACCLTAPRHYLNQCWFTISKVHWHSFEYNLQEILLQPSVAKISWKFTFVKCLWNLPGADELNWFQGPASYSDVLVCSIENSHIYVYFPTSCA